MISAPGLKCLQRKSCVCKSASLSSGKRELVTSLNLSLFVSQAPFAASTLTEAEAASRTCFALSLRATMQGDNQHLSVVGYEILQPSSC